MPSQLNVALAPRDLANFGVQSASNAAFDAVMALWGRRQHQGMKQKDLAAKIGRDPAWVSRCFSGPKNWTMRTYGELTVGLGGEPVIGARALEDGPMGSSNYDAWKAFDHDVAWSTFQRLDVTTVIVLKDRGG